MRMTFLILAAAAAFTTGEPAAATPPQGSESTRSAVDDLLAADRAFSSSGADAPLVPALAAMFADDIVMPLPNGTFARSKEEAVAALQANPANADAKAEWAPVRGGISADGTHGFTYGFMTIREPGKPDRRAKYLAYWVKRGDGWRVAAYKRAASGGGEVRTELREPAVPQWAPSGASSGDHRDSLIAAEKAFSDTAQKIGLGPAFKQFGSPDAMNMGGGADFTFGAEAIGNGMGPESTSPVHWAADQGALVAPSGDLGVTFGFIRPHAAPPDRPATIPFFTVWRRAGPEAQWRYVAE